MTTGSLYPHDASRPGPSHHALTTTSSTTRAITQSRYGAPTVLNLTQEPIPQPGPHQVLLRVNAAAVNARDWHLMRGEPRLARLMDRRSFALRRPRTATRGTDVAGVVESVGTDVTGWKRGDAVFGEGVGTFADYALARADRLALLPEGTSFEHAAALPLAATTAMLCLVAAHPAPGARVLINGASGGVGTLAIQIAKAMDLHVSAVVSPRNLLVAEALGAHVVIDYTSSDFTQQGRRYDVVVDLVGNRKLRELRRVVRADGTLVLSGGGTSGDGRTIGPMRLLVGATAAARFLPFRVLTPQAVPDTKTLAHIADLVTTFQLQPIIDRYFPLEAAADAIRYLETEHTQGKVVVTVARATSFSQTTPRDVRTRVRLN